MQHNFNDHFQTPSIDKIVTEVCPGISLIQLSSHGDWGDPIARFECATWPSAIDVYKIAESTQLVLKADWELPQGAGQTMYTGINCVIEIVTKRLSPEALGPSFKPEKIPKKAENKRENKTPREKPQKECQRIDIKLEQSIDDAGVNRVEFYLTDGSVKATFEGEGIPSTVSAFKGKQDHYFNCSASFELPPELQGQFTSLQVVHKEIAGLIEKNHHF